jgi:hypothetical protein
MSTNREIAEGDVRVAIADLLLEKWADPAGYTLADPNRDADDGDRDIVLTVDQTVDIDRPYPQLVVPDISTTGQQWGWSGDGSGPVDKFDGRVDVQVHVGGADEGDVPGGERPTLLAHNIALEVREICRSEPQGLTDPSTGDALSFRLTVLSGPTDRSALEETGNARYDVEAGYEQLLRTPQR